MNLLGKHSLKLEARFESLLLSFSNKSQDEIIEAFNSTSIYLDEILNIDNSYFKQSVSQIYPTLLHLHEAFYFDAGHR